MKIFRAFAWFIVLALLSSNAAQAEQPNRGVSIRETSGQTDDVTIDSTYWALIIGINEYAKLPRDRQLTAARPDAESIATVLQQRYGFAKERMIQLYDRQATRDEIMLALDQLAHTLSDRDSLLIYYAGHGEYDKETRRGGWIPTDAVPDRTSTYVSYADIRDYLDSMKARHILTISDACFSEALMGKTRSFGNGRAIRELFQDKSRWVLASGGLYPVPDAAKGNHSSFAYYLLRILERNEDRYLTPLRITTELQDMVSRNSPQTPKGAPLTNAGDEGGQFIFKLAYAKIEPPAPAPAPAAPTVSPEEELKRKEELKRLAEEKARIEEDAKKLKAAEQQLREREKKMEKERLAKEMEQQRQLEEERKKLEQERAALKASTPAAVETSKPKTKSKSDAEFIPSF